MSIKDTEQFEHVLRDATGTSYQTYITDLDTLTDYFAILMEGHDVAYLDKAKAIELRDLLNRYIKEVE